ncbi:MAG: NADH-quinone oxidoreductase subunit [Actinomycetota bacterium]|nr:NADH-quinone oxidoreductase subunit [Actinomycetota bacterium]
MVNNLLGEVDVTSILSVINASDSGAAELQQLTPASGIFSLVWLIIALPLLGATLLLLAGRRANAWGHWLAIVMVAASFTLGAVMFATMLGEPEATRGVQQTLFTWFSVGDFTAEAGFQLDQLSMIFVLLITGVGGLIHVYSIGYMAHDPERRKFFAYLNLFVASMLLLVLADNFALLYFGWEGVGLASYLLIGFWQYKPTAAAAAKKAFVMNRVGDFGLALGVFLIFATFGTVAYNEVFEAAPEASTTVINLIGVLLFIGAAAKSAQFPLHAWLFDAMEGPTPVSALIHAATMVTAGVYLVARANPIFNLAEIASMVVIVVGSISLIVGAVIGMAKDEIKKALAGSTMSQIGYMIVAVGLGPAGYIFGIFHLLLHGFFKADLFLGAGSVMHGMNNEEDMRRYGALRTVMVATFLTFTAGYLAILGIPPFDGFWSKDKIIEAAFGTNFWVGMVTLIGAMLTGFYMTRIFVLTFLGKARWDDDQHPHESPKSMTIPMWVLAFLSTVAGAALAFNGSFEHWLEPVLGFSEHELPFPAWLMSVGILALVLLAVFITVKQYGRDVPKTAPQHVSVFTKAARVNLYSDAFNEAVFMRPGQYLTRSLVWFDHTGVDGFVNGSAAAVGGASGRLRRWQTGYARTYALSMLGGAVLVVGALFLVRL